MSPLVYLCSLPVIHVFTYVYHSLLVLVYPRLFMFTRVYSCLPTFNCGLPIFTNVFYIVLIYICSHKITRVYLVFTFFPIFTPVYSCMFTYFYHCLLVLVYTFPQFYLRVSHCLPMFTYVFHRLLMHVYLCLPMFTSCLPMFILIYLFLLMFNRVYLY